MEEKSSRVGNVLDVWQKNTFMIIIWSAVKWAESRISNTVITEISSFAYIIYFTTSRIESQEE